MTKTLAVYGGIAFDTEKTTADEAYAQLIAACEKAGIFIIADSMTLYDENGNEIEEVRS